MKVMQGGKIPSALLLAAVLTVAGIRPAGSSLCDPGHSWWDAPRAACVNCTICDASKSYAVLRPCEIHQDTLCAPLAELDIDWSWIPRLQNKQDFPDTRLKYRNERKKPHQRLVWRKNLRGKFLEKQTDDDFKFEMSSEAGDELQRQSTIQDEDYGEHSVPQIQIESEYVYLSEGLSWDWQTSTLLLAAVTCTIFFVVVGFYSIYHARQWRHLRNNIRRGRFFTDIEGLPVKLNLILTAKEIVESEASSPESERQYSNIQCSYLEKLLAQNNELSKGGPGNVYIRTADK